eukprot:TRINITY_DN38832_c0_g1_i1.p1 TRINITY_DN38832_c0_g1~~TRINITY_DN38832_c0_g1_i1.p1  ORF type:complete len:190 (+),score=30.43 TRINITY_DN38832_c0_g1_i1:209-778(+)
MPSSSGREVAESCLDLLNIELVDLYQRTLSARPELAGRRVEAIGFQVGQQLAERYTKDRPRFGDNLEVIKFICKEFWVEVFSKQVDNLRTNHRGVFVLQDQKFRWLTRLSANGPMTAGEKAMTAAPPPTPSTPASGQGASGKTLAAAGQYLHFPCGLIRGALTALGVSCAVSAEVSALPVCSFTVRIKQ